MSNPGGRPYDTAYAAPLIATINGLRLLIVGLGDGGIHAIKPQTGEKVWSFVAAKRAINTGVVVKGTSVIVSHGDENLDTQRARHDRGDRRIADRRHQERPSGRSRATSSASRPRSSTARASTRSRTASTLNAFDVETGRELWKLPLGNVQKAPLVLADGKLYVGTESGKFFIVRPRADKAEVLSEVLLPISKNSAQQAEGTPEPVLAGAAVSRGRVFFVSSDAVYAIGPKAAKAVTGFAVDEPAEKGDGAPAWVQVTPTELVLKPGQTVKLHARLFDAKGRFLREEKATWSLQGLKGTVTDGNVRRRRGSDRTGRDSSRRRSARVSGEARARVVHPLPWTETFESYADGAVPPGWVNAVAGKYSVVTLDGQKVLQKAPDETIFQRVRMFMGPVDWSNYTVEADVRVADAAPPDGRHRHHGAALHAGPVRQQPEAEAGAVGAGDRSGRSRCRSPGSRTPGIT